MGSPVFEAMFYGSVPETGDTITVPDVEFSAFQKLILYLYTYDIDLDGNVVISLLYAANKYTQKKRTKKCHWSYTLGCNSL